MQKMDTLLGPVHIPWFQISEKHATCIWVPLFSMASQTQCDSAAIVAKRAFNNCAKLVTQKGAGTSFGQQIHIGQPIKANGLSYAWHTELHEKRTTKIVSGNAWIRYAMSEQGPTFRDVKSQQVIQSTGNFRWTYPLDIPLTYTDMVLLAILIN